MTAREESAHTCTDPTCLRDEVPEQLPGPPRTRKIYQYPVIGGLLRFFSWWLVFSGIYASFFRLSLLRATRLSGGCGGRRDSGRLLRSHMDLR